MELRGNFPRGITEMRVICAGIFALRVSYRGIPSIKDCLNHQ